MTEDLTGEHKIKATALRTEFGMAPMMIGRLSGSATRMRLAQSPKSKAFHFAARLCKMCNGTRTQAADREFDRFHQAVKACFDQRIDPGKLFCAEHYAEGSDCYLNVFRYFAKILCCHMAESQAPRPLAAAEFAIGLSSRNVVLLSTAEDETYKRLADVVGEAQYAAHGGLTVHLDRETGDPSGFRSSLTLGPIRYDFWVQLTPDGQRELKKYHREFYDRCLAIAQDTSRAIPEHDHDSS